MANKINEIIDVINSGGTGDYDAIVERLDNIDSEIDVTSKFPNQKINDIVVNNANNIDAMIEIIDTNTNILFNYVENWTIVSNEDDIFETIDGEKYLKHDTFLFYNYLTSGIHGYFIKGFPKKKIRIKSTFVESVASENLGFVMYDLSVTNDDRFQIRDSTIDFNFNETPIKTQDYTELRYPEYGTSYDDTGDYGKLLAFVRTVPPNN